MGYFIVLLLCQSEFCHFYESRIRSFFFFVDLWPCIVNNDKTQMIFYKIHISFEVNENVSNLSNADVVDCL